MCGSDALLRQQAINFILNEPGANSCIIGHRSKSEIDENIILSNLYHENKFQADKETEPA
jgi:aryl-alcohol dehydrogenase-like predicted oxidoreductase